MGKRIFITGVLILSFFHAYLQAPFTIQGIVRDSSGNFLSKATIRLLTNRDSIQTLSKDDGSFSVSGLYEVSASRERAFTILVTMNGYSPYRKGFSTPDSMRVLQLPPIVLQTEFRELQPVLVEQVRPLTIKRDTLEYHAGAYRMREGSMLADLMKKLPGIMVNADSLMVMGKKISKVYLDGKEFFGGDVQVAIKNLPYDIIDKVEILDDYGDQARLTGVKTGEPKKILNIVLQKDKRNSLLGNVTGGAGNKDQYIASLNTELLKGERKFSLTGDLSNNSSYGNEYVKFLGMSYADQWSPRWSGSGDGSLSGNNHLFQNETIQDSYYSGGHIHQQQDNTTQAHKEEDRIKYEWLYIPGPNNRLRINSSFNRQQTKQTDRIDLASTETDSGFNKTTQSATVNQTNTKVTNAESKIYFEQIYPRSGQRFSLEANLKYTGTRQAGDNLTHTQIRSDSAYSDSLQHFRLNNSNTAWNMGGILHYYIPLGHDGLLETSYGWQHTLVKDNRNIQQPDSLGKSWQVVDSLSSDYHFQTTIQDWRVAYIRHGNKVDWNLGLIAEPGNLYGESPVKGINQSYHYFHVLPAGSFNYTFTQGRKLGMEYTTTVSLPEFPQLQPVTDLSNPQYPVTGNPQLKPAILQLVRLRYDQDNLQPAKYQGFGIGIDYTTTRDQIIPNIVHPHDSSTVVQRTFYVNVNGAYMIGLNWRFELPPLLHKQLRISGSGLLREDHDISMADNTPYATNTLTSTQYLTLQYNIPDQIETNFSIGYDHSLTRYTLTNNSPFTASTLSWRLESHLYFFRNCTLTAIGGQTFSSGISLKLSPEPLYLSTTLQRSLLKKKQLMCSLIGSNILNSNTGVGQSATPNSVIQNRTKLLGRTVLFNVKWNFEQLRKKR
ncbi:MAG TPA: outer membrane beta-barrel protein [Puia sp.]|nr:outer membrane beta-barrel protein [Puia sp.]